jgi:hypothetical protein
MEQRKEQNGIVCGIYFLKKEVWKSKLPKAALFNVHSEVNKC